MYRVIHNSLTFRIMCNRTPKADSLTLPLSSSFPSFLLLLLLPLSTTSSLDSSSEDFEDREEPYQEMHTKVAPLPLLFLLLSWRSVQAFLSTLISSSLLPPRDLLPAPCLTRVSENDSSFVTNRCGSLISAKRVASSIVVLRGN